MCQYRHIFFTLMVFSSQAFSQGFLEMPDTTEVPEYESESMLLDLDVPPVRDRDPDPDAGPRLNVKEFRLQGVVEFPKLGITREALIGRIEQIRFDLMSEGELTDSGYTLDELGEVSDLIAEIEKDTEEEHVGALEVQKLVFLIREQRRRRGVTLGMIETVADTITRYYRERGFILAKAYIPEQKVRDGVVTLTLLLGELGEINVENNKRTSAKTIAKVFAPDLNKPVTNWNIEEALYLVNDIPGLSAQGFFQPGSQVGDTRLNVNVLSEDWYTVNARYDNHGSDTTGKNRAYLDFSLLNPLGLGDQLKVSLLNSFSPDNTTFGALRYDTHLGHPRWRMSTSISSNDFLSETVVVDPGNEANLSTISFEGKSTVSDVFLTYHLKRSRIKSYSISFGVSDIKTSFNTGGDGGNNESENNVLNTSLNFNFDVLSQKTRRLHLGAISLMHTDNIPLIASENSGASDLTETGQTFYVAYDYSMLSFVKIPFTDVDSRIVLKHSGQYSGKAMTNVNQFSMTGPTKARGFDVNTVLFDDALFLGADWLFQAPKFGGFSLFGKSIDRIIQPYLFVDIGYGVSHPILAGEGDLKGKLGDVGVGVKFDIGNFKANASWSSPVLDDIDLSEEDTPSSGVYFEMQYSF